MCALACPAVVVANVVGSYFFPHRELKNATPFWRDGEPFPQDTVVSALARENVVRLTALGTPRGARDTTVVLVFSATARACSSAPALRAAVSGLVKPNLHELLLVMPQEALEHKNVTAVVAEMCRDAAKARAGRADAKGARRAEPVGDPEGAAPFILLLPYQRFAANMPCQNMPRHSLASAAEITAWFRAGAPAFSRIRESDVGAVWLGARPGQLVRVEHDSITTITESALRTVVPDDWETSKKK